MFIQTEATPNPATLKFLPGRVVLPESTFEARDAEAAGGAPTTAAAVSSRRVAAARLAAFEAAEARAAADSKTPIIADGGLRTSGDAAKQAYIDLIRQRASRD